MRAVLGKQDFKRRDLHAAHTYQILHPMFQCHIEKCHKFMVRWGRKLVNLLVNYLIFFVITLERFFIVVISKTVNELLS